MFFSDDCDDAFDEILSGIDIREDKLRESNDYDRTIEISNSVNRSADDDRVNYDVERNCDVSILIDNEPIVENHTFKVPKCDSVKRQKKEFPGPAGLIADKHKSNFNNSKNIIPLSQNFTVSQFHRSGSLFEKSPWCVAIDELINNKLNPNDCSIECVKSKESSRTLENHRIETLVGVVKSVDHNSHDPLITVMDPTGEFRGILHRDAWNVYNAYLIPLRSVVLLRRVSVLTVGKLVKNSYLDITLDNVSAIYCDEESLSILSDEKRTNKTSEDDSRYRLDTLDVVDWNSESVAVVRCFDRNLCDVNVA